MAHKKGVGSTDNGRDSNSKRLGVKLFGGQFAIAGNIIIRQRGTKFHPGRNVGLGKDFTIYSLVDGTVAFKKGKKNRTFVHVIPDGSEEVVATKAAPAKAAPKAAPAPAKEAPTATDNLTKIEGIGPKIGEILTNAGIATFEALSNSDADKIREILAEAGNRYKSHDPTTWPQQAALARDGKWDELKTLQDALDGGRPIQEEE